ncbi:MAG: CHAT domain-containing protein, partial [Xenococcaceae cyanobacterium]
SMGSGSGGNITINSGGSVDTSTGVILSGSLGGPGGTVNITATNDINTSAIASASLSSNGGNITLTSTNGSIDTTTPSSIATLDGFQIPQGLNSFSFSNSDNGGAITLNAAGNITTGTINSSGSSGNGGNITINSSNGAIDTSAGSLNSSSNSGSGGEINLTSSNSSISTADINSSGASGGNITIDASTTITTGTINSSGSSGNGGNVTLDPSGNITVTSINAQGGGSGTGGNVDITTEQFFQATGTFTDRNGLTASISTAGGNGGGSITIRHGGNGITPFVLGDATTNGTAGAITSGTFMIVPNQSFLFTERQGNISIISIEEPPTDDRVELLEIAREDSDPTDSAPISTPPIPVATLPPTIPVIKFEEARELLREIEREAAVKPALIYVSFTPPGIEQDFARLEAGNTSEYDETLDLPEQSQLTLSVPPAPSDELELLVVTQEDEPIRVKVPGATREQVEQVAEELYRQAQNSRSKKKDYQAPAQQLYQWIIEPLEAQLKEKEIENLLFVMPSGLRLVPLAALYDAKTNQYMAQKYSTGFAPSLSLTDARYQDIKDAPVLALGASAFAPDQKQSKLPAVGIEVPLIVDEIRDGKFILDEEFTLKNLKESRQENPFPIIHLATHADFQTEDPEKIYIQLYNEKLDFEEFRALGLDKPTVELLVISACRSAYGAPKAELGFGGLAAQIGVKTVIASLWYVGDTGTLALMTELYSQLSTASIKAEALRLAQVSMIEGQVKKEEGEIRGTRRGVPLPEEIAGIEEDLSHPFYWAAFTMIGSPW